MSYDPADTNGDGVADAWGADYNGDGYYEEIVVDTNQNGLGDTYLYDTNQNGYYETVLVDSDEDGTPDYAMRSDLDEDGLPDQPAPSAAPAATDADAAARHQATMNAGAGISYVNESAGNPLHITPGG
ncbi:MAG: hypothetical protein ACRDT4_11845 [Micromonosporaceae bacterium]